MCEALRSSKDVVEFGLGKSLLTGDILVEVYTDRSEGKVLTDGLNDLNDLNDLKNTFSTSIIIVSFRPI